MLITILTHKAQEIYMLITILTHKAQETYMHWHTF